MATADWIKEAEEQAKRYSDTIKQSNQYLIDQLNQSKQNSLAQLEQSQNSALEKLQRQQDNALYNLNTQKSDIYRTANDNAQQLNVNRLLNLRDNQYAMNRAGLGNQGIVGSQVNSINNNYGTNLTGVLNQRAKDLNALALQRENTNLGYDVSRNDLNNNYVTNRLNLENEYGNNIANLQREIDAQALNQYNNIYQNYLALKQQEYENEMNRLAQEEAKRQWQAEFDLAKKNASRSYSSGGSRKAVVSNNQFDDNQQNNNSTLSVMDAIRNAANVTANSINGKNVSMKSVGKMGNQTVYTDGKGYYLKDGNTYIDVTNQYSGTINKSTKGGGSGGFGGGKAGSR